MLRDRLFSRFGAPRGFTLVELLVVIAIIGILAGIVLASLGSTRQRGAVAGVAANLATMRTSAAIFSSNAGYSYDGFCVSTANNGGDRHLDAAKNAAGISAATVIDGIGAAGQATCNDGVGGFATEVPLGNLVSPSGQFWCVDYNGYSGTTSASTLTSAADYTCN
ncbi:MAG TPA: prepilin-type N-terminal cleavage/methylation domain-containing protein [Candidatus Paceibacterota bacterium]|nr:prepilin-type N-terminal cleavage/methylation domain-containing protein [Candidatus Paceibacterota bacterium]